MVVRRDGANAITTNSCVSGHHCSQSLLQGTGLLDSRIFCHSHWRGLESFVSHLSPVPSLCSLSSSDISYALTGVPSTVGTIQVFPSLLRQSSDPSPLVFFVPLCNSPSTLRVHAIQTISMDSPVFRIPSDRATPCWYNPRAALCQYIHVPLPRRGYPPRQTMGGQ